MKSNINKFINNWVIVIVCVIVYTYEVNAASNPYTYGSTYFDYEYSTGYISNASLSSSAGSGVTLSTFDDVYPSHDTTNRDCYTAKNTAKRSNVYVDYYEGASYVDSNGVVQLLDVRVYLWTSSSSCPWTILTDKIDVMHLFFATEHSVGMEFHFYTAGYCGKSAYEQSFKGVARFGDIDTSEYYIFKSGYNRIFKTSNSALIYSGGTDPEIYSVLNSDEVGEDYNRIAAWIEINSTPSSPFTIIYGKGVGTRGSGMGYRGLPIQYYAGNTLVHTSYAVPYGRYNLIDASQFTKTGYTIDGWYDSNSYTTKVTKGTTGASGTTKYYGKYIANTYKVRFNKNGGTGSMSDMTYTYDKSEKLTANSFSKIGYKFTGWNTKADGSGTSYANQASVKNLTSVNGEIITLYAQWELNEFKQIVQVRYENTDGTFTAYSNVINANYQVGSTVSWSRPADNTYKAASITSYKVTEAKTTKVTVYRKKFQVTLTAGTGISSVHGAANYRVGQSVTIDATVSTGYTWKNWTGTFTETTKNYTFAMPSSDVTLTANAEDKTAPTVTLSQTPTDWTNGNVTLKAIASDDGVGLHDIPFSWDNGTTWVTSDTSIVEKNGTYSVIVRDKAGNTATASITVTNIDKLSPNIDGLEDFATISEIDRNEGKQTVTVTFTDPSNTDYGASGIKGGTLTVTNSDNGLSNTWTIDSTGIIEIDITNREYSELFYGNFKVTVEAEDNVGNKSTKSFDITEFTLDTELIHANNYKSSLFIKGETALFIFYAGGYPDEVRVYFPTDAGLEQDYSETFYYTKQKAIETGVVPFYVPLDAIEGDYTIYVESYKNGKLLQTKSQAFQITEETILDRLQTQLSR